MSDRPYPGDDAIIIAIYDQFGVSMKDAMRWFGEIKSERSAENSRLRDTLENCQKAINSLPSDALGYGQMLDNEGNDYGYPLRDELSQEIISALSTADDGQTDPDHEPDNRLCACPTCINEGWAAHAD